jgi:hypothetical protein
MNETMTFMYSVDRSLGFDPESGKEADATAAEGDRTTYGAA